MGRTLTDSQGNRIIVSDSAEADNLDIENLFSIHDETPANKETAPEPTGPTATLTVSQSGTRYCVELFDTQQIVWVAANKKIEIVGHTALTDFLALVSKCCSGTNVGVESLRFGEVVVPTEWWTISELEMSPSASSSDVLARISLVQP